MTGVGELASIAAVGPVAVQVEGQVWIGAVGWAGTRVGVWAGAAVVALDATRVEERVWVAVEARAAILAGGLGAVAVVVEPDELAAAVEAVVAVGRAGSQAA